MVLQKRFENVAGESDVSEEEEEEQQQQEEDEDPEKQGKDDDNDNDESEEEEEGEERKTGKGCGSEDDSDDSGDGDDDKGDRKDGVVTEGKQTQGSKSENPLSRRSRKKLEKYATPTDKTKRRAAERERRKRRAAEMRDNHEKDPEVESFAHKKKRLKQNKISSSDCKLRVAVDCSFDDLMEKRDLSKLCKEIQSSYTVNRRLADPLQLSLTGLNDTSLLKKKFGEVYQGSENWDIRRESKNVDEVFPSEEIVYLTSESENVLEKLDDGKVYVIGGLSDQDRHKGHCHRTASSKGFAHARLPIEEHVESPSCRVLTVSRVFGAFAEMTKNGGDWAKALEAIMPKKRKTTDEESEKGEQKQSGGAQGKGKKKRTKRGGKKHRKEKTAA